MGSRQGIEFFVVPDSPPDKQVRMDVAAFVGFASAGPVDTPVAVEDAAYFEEIFGPDQPLAWNPIEGQMEYGHLGPAVRAFFRNGGTRCWVVRVAREPETNRFPVPCLMQVVPPMGRPAYQPEEIPEYRGVELMARSPGSWSDGLRVSTVLESWPLGTARALPGHEPYCVEITQPVREPVGPGDLLRLTPAERGLLLFLLVESAQEQSPDGEGNARWQVSGQEFWFSTEAAPADSPAEVTWLSPDGATRGATGPCLWYKPDGETTRIDVQDQEQVVVGTLLGVRLPGDDPAGGGPRLVSAVEVETEWASNDDDSPFAMQIKGNGFLRPLSRLMGRALAGEALGPVEGLNFTLWTQSDDGSYHKAEGLSFTPDGYGYPGLLPSDEQLFQAEDERLAGDLTADDPFWNGLILPRFPLAAPVRQPGEAYPLLLPIGMPTALRPEIAGEAMHRDTPPLVRDGLCWTEDADPQQYLPPASFLQTLFLDPDLARTPTSGLMSAAFTKRHIAMQKLRGIHAVIPLEEATLLCVPDLAHYRWDFPLGGESWLVLPSPQIQLGIDEIGSLVLTWSATGHRSTVESAADPDFRVAVHRAEVSGSTWVVPPLLTTGPRYFRVRAQSGGHRGPWSNTEFIAPPPKDFSPIEPALHAPKLQVESHRNSHEVRWDPGQANQDEAVTYRLELDQDPDFAHPTRYYEGPGTAVSIWQAGGAYSYLRVRAIKGDCRSPWSGTGVIPPLSVVPQGESVTARTAFQMYELTPSELPDDRRKRAPIHLALLRLCHARGDLFGILSLPIHYPDAEVIHYVHHLSALAGVPEADSLTYGALYVPWVRVEASPGEERLIPPDGPATGMIAALSIKSGVWIPPAYQQLLGVLGLHHDSPQDSYAAMLGEGINVVINPPGKVLVRSAQSLSQDDRMRMINVRRLMMLVRRLAVQEGMELIFQPNTDSLRQSAHMHFERLLNDLFVRGAFAGATPAESYRVAVDPALNSPDAQVEGRLVIELDVAPVQPLVFMTVRLMQDEGRAPVVSEV